MTVELPFLPDVGGRHLLPGPCVAVTPGCRWWLRCSSPSMRTYRATPSCCTSPCPLPPRSVWAFASYLRSRHLQDWKWSLIFGVAIAAMLLSRSMAVVYLVPLLAAAGIDVMVDIFKNGHPLRWPALGACSRPRLLLAGPWWLVSGDAQPSTICRSAGYQPSSGYTSRGGALNATTVLQRARWTHRRALAGVNHGGAGARPARRTLVAGAAPPHPEAHLPCGYRRPGRCSRGLVLSSSPPTRAPPMACR